MSTTMYADTSGLNAYLAELEESAEEATRPAAQAGIQVLYNKVKSNVAALGKKTGNLDRSIYQAFSEDQSRPGHAEYHTSWNATKAPHGHLVEFGHLQRYEVVRGKGGNLVTAVRPEMQGKPKPKRNASQASKDAYFVPRKGGPVQIPAKAFVRNAQSEFDRALEAAKAELFTRMKLE